jgi:hypothetical protein
VTGQRALGHINVSVTLANYSRLWPNTDDRTSKAAAELFAQTIKDAAHE